MTLGIESFVKERLDAKHFEKFEYIYAGGKRVRPLLIQKICERYDKEFKPLLAPAAAIEILHCATLIHDDVLDEEQQRRGKKSFQKFYGLNNAITFGDYFFSVASEIFAESNAFQKLQLEFMRTLKTVVEGQIMELENQVSDLDSYFQYAEKKTANLFALCTRIPHFYYDLKDPSVLEFGKEFGQLFQIADDLSTPNEKYNILNFTSREEAESLYRAKYKYLQSLNVLNLEELPLNYQFPDG